MLLFFAFIVMFVFVIGTAFVITCEIWGETQKRENMLYDPTFKEHIDN